MGKSLSSDCTRARSQKQQKEAWRHAAPDVREHIPAGAGGAARSYHFYGAYQRISSNQKGLLVSPFLEFLSDRSVRRINYFWDLGYFEAIVD